MTTFPGMTFNPGVDWAEASKARLRGGRLGADIVFAQRGAAQNRVHLKELRAFAHDVRRK